MITDQTGASSTDTVRRSQWRSWRWGREDERAWRGDCGGARAGQPENRNDGGGGDAWNGLQPKTSS
jgi:hypothetical protein